jgi:putative oxidoreductase
MQPPVPSFLKRDPTIILRITLFIILIMHSVPGMLNGGVYAFGSQYLNEVGFAPVGVPLAWAIKISHVVCAVLLLVNRYIIIASVITIIVLVMGIVMVHFKEGWFVVGGGRNGVEFNILLISALIYLMLRNRK